MPCVSLRTDQIIGRAGISYRAIDHWTRRGYVRSRDRDREGSGWPRYYDDTEVWIICLMARMVRAGFRPAAAAVAARTCIEERVQALDLGPGLVLQVGTPITVDGPTPVLADSSEVEQSTT